MNCSSPLRFGIFILIQDGNSNLSWTLDLEQQVKKPFQAYFVLDSVTTNHNGTFRCYGYFRNNPQVWSSSSDPVDVLVSESKNQSGIHTESGLGRYQKVLIGVLVTLLLIFFLVLLLLLFCYLCKSKEKNTAQGETKLHLLAGDPEPSPSDRLPQKRSNPDAAIKEENMYTSVKDTHPEESLELDSWVRLLPHS
ncbi:leukocyte immunoglobulin-like receptor subfamily B member 4-like protein [Cricetulus griseus]|nr:leukocyte immunoglobulin-like receptor subfamily B member 4-like protein [Cricetulus griseus]